MHRTSGGRAFDIAEDDTSLLPSSIEEENLKDQFKCYEPFNLFEALQFHARDFVEKPRPTKTAIRRHYRLVALQLHPDKCRDPSQEKYSFQQLHFAYESLTGAWREDEILRAIRRYLHDGPPEPQRPRARAGHQHADASDGKAKTESGPARDCSPAYGIPERCRRPYSIIDLTSDDDDTGPPKRTGQKVNVRIMRIRAPFKMHEKQEYTWRRSQSSLQWCWATSLGYDRKEVDAKYLLTYLRRLSIVIRVNAVWITVVVQYNRATKMFEGWDSIEEKKLEIACSVMRDMIRGSTRTHVGYLF
ncbi:hypothetical protein F4679DRAFT_583889 [Xylaria curta]|nr:hypothetical protein F4679DRAFT_583889 [Xylaria curta]